MFARVSVLVKYIYEIFSNYAKKISSSRAHIENNYDSFENFRNYNSQQQMTRLLKTLAKFKKHNKCSKKLLDLMDALAFSRNFSVTTYEKLNKLLITDHEKNNYDLLLYLLNNGIKLIIQQTVRKIITDLIFKHNFEMSNKLLGYGNFLLDGDFFVKQYVSENGKIYSSTVASNYITINYLYNKHMCKVKPEVYVHMHKHMGELHYAYLLLIVAGNISFSEEISDHFWEIFRRAVCRIIFGSSNNKLTNKKVLLVLYEFVAIVLQRVHSEQLENKVLSANMKKFRGFKNKLVKSFLNNNSMRKFVEYLLSTNRFDSVKILKKSKYVNSNCYKYLTNKHSNTYVNLITIGHVGTCFKFVNKSFCDIALLFKQ